MESKLYPIINNFSDLLPYIKDREEIKVFEESVAGETVITVCYMIAKEDTFNSEWLRECRGIVFEKKTGRLLSRPFHKFFNIGEKNDTRIENIQGLKILAVKEKIDGSMVIPVLINGSIYCKTKKSFNSDVALKATSFIEKTRDNRDKNLYTMIKELLIQGKTPLFEYTDPDCRIVITYEQPELKLITVRDNITGKYWSEESIQSLSRQYNVKSAKTIKEKPLSELILETIEQINNEGCVIQFSNGLWVKQKSEWYVFLHKGMTLYRERDIARICLSDSIDDFKSFIKDERIISQVDAVESKFRVKYYEFINEYTSLSEKMKSMTQYDSWQIYGTDPRYKIASNILKGHVIDFVMLYKSRRLKYDFSLNKIE